MCELQHMQLLGNLYWLQLEGCACKDCPYCFLFGALCAPLTKTYSRWQVNEVYRNLFNSHLQLQSLTGVQK